MIKVTYKSKTDGNKKVVHADHLTTESFTNGDFALLDESNTLIFVGSLLNIINIEAFDVNEYLQNRAEGQGD